MECNKDEAGRAKEIAEKKFAAKDLAGAKKFAVKAHHLYPELDGLAETMAVLEVHIVAENKVNGEMDWYGMLQVNQFVDEATVRKQYRKLALLLHPDKNNSVGADGAFKFLSEAWSILSDKVKRMSSDQKRKGVQHKRLRPHKTASDAQSTTHVFSPAPPAPAPAAARAPMPCSIPHAAPRRPPQEKTPTFWTACFYCKVKYEYLREYENRTLLCTNCQKAFLAQETTVNNMKDAQSTAHTPIAAPAQMLHPIPPTLRRPPQPKTTTFLTGCPFCKVQYKYLRKYENCNLFCRNCRIRFCAAEIISAAPAQMPCSIPPVLRPPPQQQTFTFWTACPVCQMQYEYLGEYENCNLFCQNCRVNFYAVETTNAASAQMPCSIPPIVRPSPQQKTSTFLAACPVCEMQYEYLREYENCNLFCQNCQGSFYALETRE